MFTKYRVKYETKEKHLMIGGMDNSLVPNFIKEINTIYSHIKSMYSHGDIIVLTGSGALLYYLHSLGFVDLIDKLNEPNDIDFLLLTSEPNATIRVPFIGDHKRKQKTHVSSATFENDWVPYLKFKSFDLTISKDSIKYNQVGEIKLISLSQLKSYYIDNSDIRGEDKLKIKIIQEIELRLEKNPRNDIVGPEEFYSVSKKKIKQIPINYQDEKPVGKILFPASPGEHTPTSNKSIRTNLFGTPESKPIGKILFPDSP